jgi:putative spermidine/putrescine transport system permease protein
MKRGARTSIGDRIGVGLVLALGVLGLAVLVVPSLIVLAVSFDTRAFVSFPPEGFTLRWYAALADNAQLVRAIVNSLWSGLVVMVLCILLGVPAALASGRGRFRWRGAVPVIVLLPHAVPGVVLGVAVLFAGSAIGLRPSLALQSFAVTAFILAVLVRTVLARLERLDPALEEAAANLGAGRARAFRDITLPLLLPAILAGAAFTFIEGFDNISIAIFTHGMRNPPLPVELLGIVQTETTPLVAAISGVQILLSTLLVAIVAATIGLRHVSD